MDDLLKDLCQLNTAYNSRLFLLKKTVQLADFEYLNQHKHFDLALAFLVIHQITNNFKEQLQILKSLLSLCDNLIIEVSDDSSFRLTRHCKELVKQSGAAYLGQVKRYKDPIRQETGYLFWFKNETSPKSYTQKGILQHDTFDYLHGVYP